MTPPSSPIPMTDPDQQITATVLRESGRLGRFIRRRIRDPGEADDILQDVFYEFVQACRLPAPIEQASAWLFRVARYRIIDRFRKKKELAVADLGGTALDADGGDSDDGDYRLDLMLPDPAAGPEAAYARTVLMQQLQQALDELPAAQREVFIAHELDGLSFKEMAAASGVAVNTLLARKRYAVLFLRQRLQAVYDDIDVEFDG
jgi:RNA polymerase sigma factor (sigma-70 family)